MDQKKKSVKVGFLYPGFAAEDDYPRLGQMIEPNAEVKLVHTQFIQDAHTVEALSEMGSPRRLIEGARNLKNTGIQSVLWTSTSASFVRGLEGMKEQVAILEDQLQVPASTTALAFIEAVHAIGAKCVTIAATYPEDITLIFKSLLESAGLEVIQHASKGIITAAEVGTLTKGEVIRMAIEHDHSEADAILIPDTALHSAAYIEALEQAVQKPVLTANQVSFWEALRLTGYFKPQTGLGTLFETEPQKQEVQ